MYNNFSIFIFYFPFLDIILLKKGLVLKKYRPNVAAVIVSSKYPEKVEILIAKRNDIDAWQFPQGGIDEGESPKEALLRELKEEIGTDEVEVLASMPEWMKYDFPKRIAEKMYPYDGQKQKYFLVRLKKGAKIDLNTEHPEFEDYKFVSIDEVFEYVKSFKRPVYRKVIDYFKKEGYL
jgi:putative (di)nucleoside polyphosphate hydrolase